MLAVPPAEPALRLQILYRLAEAHLLRGRSRSSRAQPRPGPRRDRPPRRALAGRRRVPQAAPGLLFTATEDEVAIAGANADLMAVLRRLPDQDFADWALVSRAFVYTDNPERALRSERFLYQLAQREHPYSAARIECLELITGLPFRPRAFRRSPADQRGGQPGGANIPGARAGLAAGAFPDRPGQNPPRRHPEKIGRKPESEAVLQEAIDLLEPMARDSPDVRAKTTLARACLLADRRNQSRQIMKELLEKGWRRGDLMRLAAKKGVLPTRHRRRSSSASPSRPICEPTSTACPKSPHPLAGSHRPADDRRDPGGRRGPRSPRLRSLTSESNRSAKHLQIGRMLLSGRVGPAAIADSWTYSPYGSCWRSGKSATALLRWTIYQWEIVHRRLQRPNVDLKISNRSLHSGIGGEKFRGRRTTESLGTARIEQSTVHRRRSPTCGGDSVASRHAVAARQPPSVVCPTSARCSNKTGSLPSRRRGRTHRRAQSATGEAPLRWTKPKTAKLDLQMGSCRQQLSSVNLAKLRKRAQIHFKSAATRSGKEVCNVPIDSHRQVSDDRTQGDRPAEPGSQAGRRAPVAGRW